MPKAFYHAGYLVGSISTIVIGSIALYCIQVLLKIHHELCKRNEVCILYRNPNALWLALCSGRITQSIHTSEIFPLSHAYTSLYGNNNICAILLVSCSTCKAITQEQLPCMKSNNYSFPKHMRAK